MVDFTRAPATPAPVETNAKANAEAVQGTPLINYEDATDLGLQAQERADRTAQAQATTASLLQSIEAGAKSSVLYSTLHKAGAPDFTPAPGYDASAQLQDDPNAKDMRLSDDENKYLMGAKSPEDYAYRMQQVPIVRKEQQDASAHPIAAGVAAITADAPSMLIPGLSEAAFGRTVGTAVRVAADAYDVGSAVYSSDQLGQSAPMNALVAGTGVVDALHLLTARLGRVNLRDSTAGIDSAAADVESAARADATVGPVHDTDPTLNANQTNGVVPETPVAPVKPDEPYVPDPDQVAAPTPQRDLDDDISSNNSTVAPEPAPRESALPEQVIDTNKAYESRGNSKTATYDAVPLNQMNDAVMARYQELASTGALKEDFPHYMTELMPLVSAKAGDFPVKFSRATGMRGHVLNQIAADGTVSSHMVLPLPAAAMKQGKLTVSQVVGHMSERDLRRYFHESIHAATSSVMTAAEHVPHLVSQDVLDTMKSMEGIRQHLRSEAARQFAEGALTKETKDSIDYHLQNSKEMIAGIGDTNRGYTDFLTNTRTARGKESVLRKITKGVMKLLGYRNKSPSAFTNVVDSLADMLERGPDMRGGKFSLTQAAPDYASPVFKDMQEAAQEAARKDPGNARYAAAKATLKKAHQQFSQWMALRDDIARGDDPARNAFADTLVSDATRIGPRDESVVDLKRRMLSEMGTITQGVEKSISDQLARNGTGYVQQFFYRKAFVQARRELEDEMAQYLSYAHSEHINGRVPEPPSESIKQVVDDYVNSGWAEKWYDHLQASGLNGDSTFEKSPYYLPRRYSSDRLRQLMQSQGVTDADVIDVFAGAIRAAYPAMDRDLSRQVARTWHQSLTSAQPRQGAMWRRAINGMSNDEFVQMLMDNGVEADEANRILQSSVGSPERTGSNPVKNLRKRSDLDLQREFVARSGRSFRLADIMDSDVTRLMNQYNNRMSGRAALHAKGYGDLKDLSNEIDTLRAGLPGDVSGWTNKVDDTIDSIMGYPPRGDTPNALLGSGYLSNAMMLKNSGLYQLADLAFAAKSFGMFKVVRGMMQSGLFKHARVELGNDASLHGRLNNILNGSIQGDMQFRWLHTYADDNTDLTRSSQWVNVARNLAQSAYTANGMRYVHRAMVNMNSGLVRDSILAALNGSERDAKLLGQWGMRPDALERMRVAHAANPDALFSREDQIHLESVGQRFMDYLVQQNRTGETSHFAQMNPIGRVLIGYQSFAMASTNKVLRRGLENGASEALGLAILMAYQFPLMALATYAKYGMDGQQDKKTTTNLVVDALTGMSSIGGASMVMSMFTGNQSGVSMLGGFNQIVTTLKSIESKGSMSAQDASKLVPLAQEFAPLRLLINTMGE